MDKKRIAQLQNNGWDLPLIARTQPQGNMIERPQYLQEGDGYVACLRIYGDTYFFLPARDELPL